MSERLTDREIQYLQHPSTRAFRWPTWAEVDSLAAEVTERRAAEKSAWCPRHECPREQCGGYQHTEGAP